MMSVLVALYMGNVAVSPPRQLYEATFESFETRTRVRKPVRRCDSRVTTT
jgi:hypothetical protein